MNASSFKNILATAAAVVALGVSSLRADSIPLTVVDGPAAAGALNSFSTSLAGGTAVDSNQVTFTAGTLTGTLGTKVLSGVTANTLGGLTFVYELNTVSASVGLTGEGITNLSLIGWGSNVATNFALGTSYFFTNNGVQVLPLEAFRTAGVTDTIDITFPLDIQGPPIFDGQNSYQLILFTDATTYTAFNGAVSATDFDAQSFATASNVSTFVALANPTTVPDGATTALLLGASFVSLSLIKRRSKRA